MKYITLSLMLLFALTGCKKTDDVDPRDQYLGTYNVTVNSLAGYVNLGIQTTSSAANDVLIVTKDSNPEHLVFTFNQIRFTAQLSNGNKFTILPKTVPAQTSKGEQYSIGYTGDGAFSENYITGNINSEATVSGYTAKSINAIKGARK